MNKERLKYLFENRFKGKLSQNEREEFLLFVTDERNKTLLDEIIEEYLQNPPLLDLPDSEHISAVIERILHPVDNENTFVHLDGEQQFIQKRITLRAVWSAASVILFLAISLFIYRQLNYTKQSIVRTTDIPPGHNGAILTLSDGSKVVLDSAGNGIIAQQGGAEVVMNGRQLSYKASNVNKDSAVFNTVSTTRGRQFTLVLPDGSHVWINSESAVTYPTLFKGKERRVSVTGEAYFEVAKNAAMPFKVNAANKAEIEVLGTHFNIKAYSNENSLTTSLFEGSIKFRTTRQQSANLLKPGEQAELEQNGAVQVNKNIDEDKILAWKNGLFDFDGLSLEEAMRQLERWYDIDVVYEQNRIPDIHFYGQINKNISLNGLLKALQLTDVKYRLEDRKLIISQ
ncbi:MAG: FecR domain-containing protein [Arachidicoccus sp.]|nr:FecR domain-containing protein [Arachidicoccus sp.]